MHIKSTWNLLILDTLLRYAEVCAQILFKWFSTRERQKQVRQIVCEWLLEWISCTLVNWSSATHWPDYFPLGQLVKKTLIIILPHISHGLRVGWGDSYGFFKFFWKWNRELPMVPVEFSKSQNYHPTLLRVGREMLGDAIMDLLRTAQYLRMRVKYWKCPRSKSY